MKPVQSMKEKFIRGVADSTKAYQEGISAVTQNPAELGIQANDKYEANTMKAMQEKRYITGLSGVTLPGWQQAAKAGAGKLAQSAQTAGEKWGRYMLEAAPLIQQIQNEVRSMPNVTEGDAEQRMLANVRGMRTLKGVGRGRGR